MSDQPSATIIAFPVPARPAPRETWENLREPPADDAQERLRLALAGLDAALAEQRRAVADWRAALGALHGSVSALGGSLHGYHGALSRLQDQVGGLNSQARRLETWADDVLAGQP
jgi:hypothetical protein